MKHLTNDVLCLVAAGRQVAQEQAAFARKMADIAITLQREICCLRRQATEIYSAQDRQIRTGPPLLQRTMGGVSRTTSMPDGRRTER